MALTTMLQNAGIIGKNVASLMNGKGWAGYSTPIGQDTIATPTLTRGQKMFSTNAENPNIPKPKTLYFTYFNLNPDLVNKIAYKQQLIKELSGIEWDGSDVNANASSKSDGVINSMIKSAAKSTGLGKVYDKLIDTVNGSKSNNSQSLQQSGVTDFIPDKDLFLKLSYEMSKLVKGYNKPGVSFDTTELNEYNRKRIVYSGVKYDDVTVTFFDVKDNPVQQFFNAYLKFICSDFLCKDKNMWEKPIDNNHFQMSEGYKTVDGKKVTPTYYGNLNQFGLNIDSNFRLISSISFCEYYMDRLLVYTIENPVVTSIKWGESRMGDFSANEIQVTFKYEGITNDLVGIEPYNIDGWNKKIGNNIAYLRYMVNKEIKKEVATFMQTRYNTLTNNLVSDITSILKGYMNGDTKFSWNTIKNQSLNMARKYGLANEANTYAQVEQTIDVFKSKEGKDKLKYLVNVTTDPTSVIGRTSAGSASQRGGTNREIII